MDTNTRRNVAEARARWRGGETGHTPKEGKGKPMKRWDRSVMVAMVMLAWVSGAAAQSTGQQIGVMKMLMPGTTAVGVLSSTMSEKKVEELARAGAGQGVKVVIGRPKDLKDVATFYRKLTVEGGIKLILVPEKEDDLILSASFDYLREQAVGDKVGICVLDESLVAKGALCAVTLVEGKVKVVVNQKMAALIGAVVPTEGSAASMFVAR
jgi:hypothetical protein